MCGITGVFSLDGQKVSNGLLKKMTDTISHRGPDGEGHWCSSDGKVGLGHRRLAIIDLSDDGMQPFRMEDYVITYNGEIYNYLEVREDLRSKGVNFKTKTDTEVLLKAYIQYGESCLQYLDGMFAFVIYNVSSGSLFMARDRFGEKPFYYAFDGRSFKFGSEMKALWSSGVDRQINDYAAYNFIVYNNSTGIRPEDTFYEGIKQLRPAHFILTNINEFSPEQTQYWHLDYKTKSNLDFDEARERFIELMSTSIKRRMRTDVAYGCSLSGGLDSSFIVSLMSELDTKRHNTFSATFPGFERDEGRYQRLVSQSIDSNHHSISPSVEHNLDSFDDIIYHQEEPFSSASINVQYEVFKLARSKNIAVLLDGQGADETMGGYHNYTLSYMRQLLTSGQLISYIGNGVGAQKRQLKSYKYLFGGSMSHLLPSSLVGRFKNSGTHEALSILNPDFRRGIDNNIEEPTSTFPTLNHALFDSTTNQELGTLLRYSDRNAMAHSVEVRLPFLSHKVVEFMFSLPGHYKIHNGWTKWLLRKASENIVPEAVVWRKGKIGFEATDNYFYSQRNKTVVNELINSKELGKYFNKNGVNSPNLFFRKLMLGKMLNLGAITTKN